MDGSRFDAWTRRRFGLAAGRLTGSLVGVGVLRDNAEAKKKGKKDSCRTLNQSCKLTGKRACCKKGGLSCQLPVVGVGGRACCLPGNKPCQRDNDCCSEQCTDNLCACKSIGAECGGVDAACCSLHCGDDDPPTCQPA